jgi:hypothetical protein
LKSVAKKRLNLAEQYVQCIVLIVIMHVTQLRQADLNLLVVFSVLAEEGNVSRGAKRLLLSQPAVSRAVGFGVLSLMVVLNRFIRKEATPVFRTPR